MPREADNRDQPQSAEQLRHALSALDGQMATSAVAAARAELQTQLGDALLAGGAIAEARQAYETALALYIKLGDPQYEGALHYQLGVVACKESNIPEAIECLRRSQDLFQELDQPAQQALVLLQLAKAYEAAGYWNEAGKHYRKSADIEEVLGNVDLAARAWVKMALVCTHIEKERQAEALFQRAKNIFLQRRDQPNFALVTAHLASLLAAQPGRLTEARKYGEEALTVYESLGPDAQTNEIPALHTFLADICARLKDHAAAAGHRGQARALRRGTAPTHRELQLRWGPFIAAAIAANRNPGQRLRLEMMLDEVKRGGWPDLAAATRHLLAGERDETALCRALTAEEAAVVAAVLAGVR